MVEKTVVLKALLKVEKKVVVTAVQMAVLLGKH